jgi:hypothetical protein
LYGHHCKRAFHFHDDPITAAAGWLFAVFLATAQSNKANGTTAMKQRTMAGIEKQYAAYKALLGDRSPALDYRN